MIKQLRLESWKSFVDATLYVDPLTVLIGPNSGGKSNALDALLFLNRSASGLPLTTALQGDQNLQGIRGGLEWAAYNQSGHFALTVTMQGSDTRTEYRYRIKVAVGEKRCDLRSESLERLKYRSPKKPFAEQSPTCIWLFRTDLCEADTPSITARLYNEKRGTPRQSARSHSILSQLVPLPSRQEIEAGVKEVSEALRGIFVLDPIPAHMRDYSPLSEQLEPDASNIAGVIAALQQDNQSYLEQRLTTYARHLPERDVHRVYAEPVGKFGTDAMLYCDEQWGEAGEPIPVDARGLSDGTLRFLGILTAMLTRPEGTLLVVEEVDNGLHPSRAGLLLRMLTEIGEERGVDVLVTTHNPAFLDACGPELVPFITVAHRDPHTGASRLTPLEDIAQLPKLLASGTVGRLSSEGRIERALAAHG